MGARIFITARKDDFDELAQELRRLGDVAAICAENLAKADREYTTDGFNSAIEGIDAITNFMRAMLGTFNVDDVKMTRVREAIAGVRAARIAEAAIRKEAAVKSQALKVAEPVQEYPHQEKKLPASRRPKASREKKA